MADIIVSLPPGVTEAWRAEVENVLRRLKTHHGGQVEVVWLENQPIDVATIAFCNGRPIRITSGLIVVAPEPPQERTINVAITGGRIGSPNEFLDIIRQKAYPTSDVTAVMHRRRIATDMHLTDLNARQQKSLWRGQRHNRKH